MPPRKRAGSEGLTISELARRSGVKLETIRYYERIGMLPGPPRTEHGYRIYGHEDVRTFTFVRRAREAGFTLADVRMLLKLREAGGASCAEVREMASEHLESVQAKIADLMRLSERLEHAIARCSGDKRHCPVIEMLDCAP
jgi:MerR family transcriptional regulator, mercuric resistance operon regulatory protein